MWPGVKQLLLALVGMEVGRRWRWQEVNTIVARVPWAGCLLQSPPAQGYRTPPWASCCFLKLCTLSQHECADRFLRVASVTTLLWFALSSCVRSPLIDPSVI